MKVREIVRKYNRYLNNVRNSNPAFFNADDQNRNKEVEWQNYDKLKKVAEEFANSEWCKK